MAIWMKVGRKFGRAGGVPSAARDARAGAGPYLIIRTHDGYF
jgi:hypothetical protein